MIWWLPTLTALFLSRQVQTDVGTVSERDVPDPTVPPTLLAQNVTLGDLETRLGNMTTNVQSAQLALDALAFKLADIEGVTGQSRINVANAMNTLRQVRATASQNRNQSISLKSQADIISSRVRNESATLTSLSTRVTSMEQNSKILGSDAAEVAKDVSNLEDLIKKAMPGGDISERLIALQKKLSLFEETLKKGIDAEVKKDMRGLMNKVREEVADLSGKMEQGEWMPKPLAEYPQ